MFISNENVLSFFIGGEINVEVFLRSAKSIIRVKIIVFLTIECIIEKYSSIMFKDENTNYGDVFNNELFSTQFIFVLYTVYHTMQKKIIVPNVLSF